MIRLLKNIDFVAADKNGEIIEGQFVKGDILDSTNNPTGISNGSVVLHEGRYFLVTDEANLDSSVWGNLNETNLEGGDFFFTQWVAQRWS